MATAAQITANRRNALLSTGPRTAEGKARSSRNAQTHGLYVDAEDPARREAFIDDWYIALIADYRPASQHEHDILLQMALAAWQTARAEALFEKAFQARLPQGIHPNLALGIAFHEDCLAGNHIGKASRAWARASLDFHLLFCRLTKSQNNRRKSGHPENKSEQLASFPRISFPKASIVPMPALCSEPITFDDIKAAFPDLQIAYADPGPALIQRALDRFIEFVAREVAAELQHRCNQILRILNPSGPIDAAPLLHHLANLLESSYSDTQLCGAGFTLRLASASPSRLGSRRAMRAP